MPGVCGLSTFNLGYIWRHAIDKSHTGLEKEDTFSERNRIDARWRVFTTTIHQSLRDPLEDSIPRSSSAAMSISRRTFVQSWIFLRIFWIIPTPSIYSRAWLPWPDIFLTKLQFHSPSPMQISTKGITRRLLVLNLQLITFAKSHSNCTRSLRFKSSCIVVGILLSCFDQLFTADIAMRTPVATLIFCRTHTISE